MPEVFSKETKITIIEYNEKYRPDNEVSVEILKNWLAKTALWLTSPKS